MNHEYFFLISNGSIDIYKDNTRAEFKNNLAKSLSTKSDESIKLALDTVIFDNTFASYSSDREIDIILFIDNNIFVVNLTNSRSLSSLVRKINKFFAEVSYSLLKQTHVGLASHSDGKITLQLIEGVVAISPALNKFLSFGENFKVHQIQYGEETSDYFILRRKNDTVKVFTSKEQLKINDSTPEYINIVCDEIQPYPRNSSMQNIICSVPLNTFQPTIFYAPTFRRFFIASSNNISRLKIGFQQPSGRKLYFQDGSPNIIKMAMSLSKSNDFFYVQASSVKCDTFPKNNNSFFQVELPKEYRLDGKWQVGVTNVFIPKPSNIIKFDTSVYVIPNSQNYFFACFANPVKRKKYIKFPLLEFSKRELVIFLVQEFSEYFSVYLDQNENIYLNLRKETESQIQLFTSRAMLEIINSHNFLRTMSPISITTIFKERFKTENIAFTNEGMSNDNIEGVLVQKLFSVMLENTKEKTFYFDARTFYGLDDIHGIDISRIDTKRILLLAENEFLKKEEIRLLQFIQNQQGVSSSHELIPSFFFIYSDFVKESIMANNYVNLLKMVPYRSGFNNLPGGLFDFPRCEFFDVNKQYIKNMNFELRTHSGKEYLFFPENEHILITMKFQKI